MHAAATAAIIFLPYLGVVSSWIADLVPTSEQAFKDSERGTIALAALVVSGHKAVDSKFIEQSACAALTMVSSARSFGEFEGDAIVMAGPLGILSPHDPSSWKHASKRWIVQHSTHAAELAAILDSSKTRTQVMDLVPLLLGNEHPFLKRNLNYMKLAVYTLNQYAKVIFIDLDTVVVRPLFKTIALLTESVELVGYRTCTAPVNSGFFVVRPRGSNGKRRLKHLNDITLRNRCPCRSRQEPFATSGFDNWGSLTQDLKKLWNDGAYDAPDKAKRTKMCQGILNKRESTWDHAGAGTGQGLMWYYFGLKLNAYISLTYADLPIVHYNAPGPKPWQESNRGGQQHCDFIWWKNFMITEAKLPKSVFGMCPALLKPHLNKSQQVRRFNASACCRVCPGGGHFVTTKVCSDTRGLKDYAKTECRVMAELSGISS